MGRLKGETTMTVQAYRFAKAKFTAEQAKAWLKEHDVKGGTFEAAKEEKAIEDIAALDIPELEETSETPETPEFAMKALPGSRLAHYAILWGGPETADLTPYVRNSPGEWFTPQTDELLNIYKAMGKLPWLYHHGGDEKVKTTVLGAVDLMGIDEWGIWFQTQLNKAEQYKKLVSHVTEMAKAGKLGSSSGTLPGAREVAPTGEIKRWAIAEVSGTPTPMDPRMMERPFVEIKAAYKAIGLEFEQEETDPEGDEESRERDIELEKERLRLLEL